MPVEVTQLTPKEEYEFRKWALLNKIHDADHPNSKYDYRGYWKNVASKGQDQTKSYADGPHFPDTYKQHGHPSFSVESQYSAGPWDGGQWRGETYIGQGTQGRVTDFRPQSNGMTSAIRLVMQLLGK